MGRSRRFGMALILGAAVAAVAGIPGAVRASNQIPISFTIISHATFVSCPPTLCFTEKGIGTATYLGATTIHGSGVITSFKFPSATQLESTTIESYVITAGSGDTIDLTNYATGIENVFTGITRISGYWQITGGTGHFKGATGQGITTGTALSNLTAGTLDGAFNLVGYVSIGGALRS